MVLSYRAVPGLVPRRAGRMCVGGDGSWDETGGSGEGEAE